MKAGQQYIFKGFQANCNESYRKKLLAMGFIPGTNFLVKQVAPLGDPVIITIKGSMLSLRQADIALLKLENAQ